MIDILLITISIYTMIAKAILPIYLLWVKKLGFPLPNQKLPWPKNFIKPQGSFILSPDINCLINTKPNGYPLNHINKGISLGYLPI